MVKNSSSEIKTACVCNSTPLLDSCGILAVLCLSFLICKMGVMTATTAEVSVKAKWDEPDNVTHVESFKECLERAQ